MKKKTKVLEEISRLKEMMGVLKEQEERVDVNIDEPMGDDIVKTDITVKDKVIEPSDDEELQQSQMPAHYHAWRWCRQGGEVVYYLPPMQFGIQGTGLQNASQQFYNLMGSPAVGEIIHITFNPSLPQRRMCYEYLGQLVRTTALDNSATAFPSGGSGPVRDPGSYTSCQDCEQASTGPIGYCVDCVNGQMTYYPGPSGQNWTSCPPGYSDIGPNPSLPQGPCTECVQGVCTNVGWNYGQGMFNSMTECQSSPQCTPPTNYTCNNGTQCIPDPNGIYASLSDCQVNCPQQQTSYNCTNWYDPNGCQQVSGPTGQFATLDDCLGSPCQCDQWISSWPLYTNNPNYDPSINWWTGNDGPSNMNAIANQLTNVQNSNGYLSNNPSNVHYQKMKCREAALLLWQSGPPVNTACCSDQGFAVGFASSDPLGCVNSALINNSNNANTNNFGCQWFCNVLANKHNAFANTQAPVAQCKHNGAIDFLTNYMQTGQSTYLSVPASFTGPCPNIPTGPNQGSMC